MREPAHIVARADDGLVAIRLIKLTERHYAPWVKARQEQLEADVQRIWAGVA